MAAKEESDTGLFERYDPFPELTPECRLMMRSIPFSHLRGYGSQPNVSGARPKVDTRNTSYKEHWRSKSATGVEKVVGYAKTDYSHVRSRIDTGRRRATTTDSTERKRSSTETNPATLSRQFSAAQRRTARMKRASTLPFTKTSEAMAMGGVSRNRKVSAPGVSYLRSLKEVKSRVDSSDPHPQVTKQTHSLEELQIVGDFDRGSINPRFFHRFPRHQVGQNSAKSSRKFSLPVSHRAAAISDTAQSVQRRRPRLEKRATIPATTSSGGNTTEGYYHPATIQTRVATTACSQNSGRYCEPESTSESLALAEAETRKVSLEKDMEVGRPATVVDLKRIARVHEEEEGEVVRSKVTGSSADGTNRQNKFGTGNYSVGSRYSDREVGRERESEEDARGSVSSSDSVGVNPEYSNMDVDMDAFSETQTLGDTTSVGGGTETDEIVGFEVSADSTQTTVNLLHLLGHKNRSTEKTKVEYDDSQLWVIGEEEEEEEEESDMEEEISLSGGGGGGRVAEILAVPQLFVVDENDTVVEKVKTGRRRQSRGSLSSEGLTNYAPPTAGDCTLALQTLSLHN